MKNLFDFAIVHFVDSFYVAWTQPLPLSNTSLFWRIKRFYCMFAVLGEKITSIMHNRVDVVFYTKMWNNWWWKFGEISFGVLIDVFPMNFHEPISIVRALHVIKSNCMEELMYDCSFTHAVYTFQWQTVSVWLSPGTRVTSSARKYRNMLSMLRTLYEPNTSPSFNFV